MPREGTSRTHRCPDDHPHTISCYRQHLCGCERCLWANAEAARVYRRRVAYGRISKVDPGPSIRRLQELRAAGWKWKQIEQGTGCNRASLQRLIQGRVAWVTQETETRILTATVKPPELHRGLVDSTGTRRRLQALVAQGWTFTELAKRLGTGSPQSLYQKAVGNMVQEHTRRAVDALFRELWNVTPPDGATASRARTAARKHGWLTALAWDDIDNDPEPATTTPSEPGWAVTELDHLHSLGESPAQAVAALGSTVDALEKLARRHHRPDLARWVEAA